MTTITISPKFQVVIPKAVRDRLGLSAGQKLEVIIHEDLIELIPVRSIRDMRGFLEGIDTTVERDEARVSTTTGFQPVACQWHRHQRLKVDGAGPGDRPVDCGPVGTSPTA